MEIEQYAGLAGELPAAGAAAVGGQQRGVGADLAAAATAEAAGEAGGEGARSEVTARVGRAFSSCATISQPQVRLLL